MTLIFKEPETFTTPDGGEYVILPVQVDDMPLFFKLMNKRTELYKKALKEAEKKSKKKEVNDEDIDTDKTSESFFKECGKELSLVIDRTVINIKTGEPIPLKYRNPGNMVQWMHSVSTITMPDKIQSDEGDDTPLKQVKKSSGKSSQAKPT